MNKTGICLILIFTLIPVFIRAQCLSSVNPVGGTNNLLVLEKNSLRVISFYKFGQGNKYFEGTQTSDFNLINRAHYNYLSATLGYGLTSKLTLEMETGYFFNKTQDYNLDPAYSLTGRGLANTVMMAKHSLYTNHNIRFYVTGSAGLKIPMSRDLQWSDNVKLPVEVQPTIGAYGGVLGASFVKENSATGMRYFLTNRVEINGENNEDYKLGTSVYTSLYVSKHLMFPWLKGDWTTILQVRNEIRTADKIAGNNKESSGSMLFFIAPQLNYVLHEEWYISGMIDIPVYQDFNGIQLGAATGFTLVLSKTFAL